MIVAHVIGANGDLIHIKYIGVCDIDLDLWRGLDVSHLRPGFRRAICKASMTEDAVYAQANSEDQYVDTSGASKYYVERNFDRHLDCDCCDGGGRDTNSENLHFALSASCRQLNHLANTTLYAKNTFSFDDALSFKQFLAGLGLNQKRMIRSLHLSRPATRVRRHINHSYWWAWKDALEPSSVRLLEGLRTVHLCLDMDTAMPYWPRRVRRRWDDHLWTDLQPFLQLRILPLTKVTVVITDDFPTIHSDSVHGEWTVAKKREWAEDTRRKLLEPYVEGAENASLMHDSTT